MGGQRATGRARAAGASPTCAQRRRPAVARSRSTLARADASRQPGRPPGLRRTTQAMSRNPPIDRGHARTEPCRHRPKCAGEREVPMFELLRARVRRDADEAGQGLAEYALILALIAIVAIVALIFL